MKRITNINQLKPGDKIFIVNQDGSLEILEFRELHPHHDSYSLFLNQNKDGMSKFYNKTLENEEYYLYDGGDECWKFIYERKIAEHKRLIGSIEERIKKFVEVFGALDSEHKGKEFYDWHHILTGSCRMGRDEFCKAHNVDLTKKYTVKYFLEITENSYGSNIIKQVRESYKLMEE